MPPVSATEVEDLGPPGDRAEERAEPFLVVAVGVAEDVALGLRRTVDRGR
jgi:hypothetical protein